MHALRIGVVSLTGLMLALVASWSGRAQSTDPDNGATWYARAIERLSDLPLEQQDLISDYARDPTAADPIEMRRIIEEAAPILELIERGSEARFVDHQFARREYQADLAHLAPLRQLTYLACVDARLRSQEGDGEGAAERLAMVCRMTGQLREDRVPISSRLGEWIFGENDGIVNEAIDNGLIDAHGASAVLDAMQSLDPDDPFGVVDAMAAEQARLTQWIAGKVGDPDAMSQLKDMIDPFGRENGPLASLAQLDETSFASHLAQYDAVADRAASSFASDDPDQARAELATLESELASGEHGDLARFLFDEGFLSIRLTTVFESRQNARDLLAQRIPVLERLANGAVGPEHLADNAAIWYLRGIEVIRRVEDDDLASLRATDPCAAPEVDECLMQMLDEVNAAIDLVRHGSRIRRCDFSLARQGSSIFIPEYLSGMRDALRVLHADAKRLMQTGNLDSAIDRLAISLRVIAHLSADESLLSSAVAHVGFRHAMCMLDSVVHDPEFPNERAQDLRRAIEQLGRADPFGYVRNGTATRQLIAPRWKRRIPIAVDHPAWMRWIGPEPTLHERVQARVSTADEDQLVLLLAMLEFAQRSEARGNIDADRDRLAALHDIVSAERIKGIAALFETLALIGPIEVEMVGLTGLPPISDIVDLRASARGELRATSRWTDVLQRGAESE
jgi:hypothetical protein